MFQNFRELGFRRNCLRKFAAVTYLLENVTDAFRGYAEWDGSHCGHFAGCGTYFLLLTNVVSCDCFIFKHSRTKNSTIYNLNYLIIKPVTIDFAIVSTVFRF